MGNLRGVESATLAALEEARAQNPGCEVRLTYGGRILEVRPLDSSQQPIEGLTHAAEVARQKYVDIRLGQAPLLGLALEDEASAAR